MTHVTSTKAPMFGIERLRMGTDGHGITTLVGFMSCPLKCAYCLNDRCRGPIFQPDGKTLYKDILMLTPQELYERVRIDNLYFQATGGGICFGGGEPMLYYQFIHEFRQLCGPRWKITLETSLHGATQDSLKLLADDVDLWIVDIKDINPAIYEQYTGKESQVLDNLMLLSKAGVGRKTIIKVPLIPGYNTREDVEKSIDELQFNGFGGFTQFMKFTYRHLPSQHLTSNYEEI